MSIIADNPVLIREMRRRLRFRAAGRPWTYGALIIAGIAIWYYAVAMVNIGKAEPMDAADWWCYTMYGLLAAICIIAPAISSTSISQERERQTWETLALTRLSASQVLFGKWLALLSVISFLPAVMLPLALTCAFRDNISIWTTVTVYLYLFLNSAFFLAVGLVCSFCLSKSPWATALALVGSAGICLGTAVIDGIINSFNANGNFSAYTMTINPFWILRNLLDLAQSSPATIGMYQAGGDMLAVVVSVCFELTVIGLSIRWMAGRYGKAAIR
jgi:ABC-type transport system involved in multi-copper enzyme maturation permease subunit